MPATTATLMRRAMCDFAAAWAFAQRTHAADLAWIRARQSMVVRFADFFEEYCYVVVASGFRGRTAARLAPQLAACRGDERAMLRVFSNRQKCAAIAAVWRDVRPVWSATRSAWRTEDDLCALPRIGPIVKYHLARNIGLRSCVKPDVHVVRYVDALYNFDDGDDGDGAVAAADAERRRHRRAQRLVQRVARRRSLAPGEADFALWLWLSHGASSMRQCKRKRKCRRRGGGIGGGGDDDDDENDNGDTTYGIVGRRVAHRLDCCDGGYRLR